MTHLIFLHIFYDDFLEHPSLANGSIKKRGLDAPVRNSYQCFGITEKNTRSSVSLVLIRLWL